MELYLRWLAKHETEPGEQSPMGIILCAGKNTEQIELLELGSAGIHVAEYLTVLPQPAVLREKLHRATTGQPQHLTCGISNINSMFAQRRRCLCFRSVLNQPFGYKFLDESKSSSNICAAPLLSELSKGEEPWQPAKDGARRIAVRFHPSHVVLNLRAKPTVTDSVDG